MSITFYKKYNTRFLQDDGGFVSEEYHQFQKGLYADLKKTAKKIGAEIIKKNYGHYYESFFFKKNDQFIYVNHEDINRTLISFDKSNFFLVRYAKDENDYRGGTNQYCSFLELEDKLSQMFD